MILPWLQIREDARYINGDSFRMNVMKCLENAFF